MTWGAGVGAVVLVGAALDQRRRRIQSRMLVGAALDQRRRRIQSGVLAGAGVLADAEVLVDAGAPVDAEVLVDAGVLLLRQLRRQDRVSSSTLKRRELLKQPPASGQLMRANAGRNERSSAA